ncbi:MAG: hypothetical protein GXC73_14430 [Chitinophagaceae bacterium]|nr:hypothetical protein [Chitinophagaceae bacterium]
MIRIIFCLSVLLTSGCKKNKLSEIDKLPPATQTGSKTFGCLVNGKAWIPSKEDWFSTSALRFYYDNSPGGQFAITAEFQNSSQNRNETIGIVCDSILTRSTYDLNNKNATNGRVLFMNSKIFGACRLISSSDNDAQITGFISITRFDLAQGIICGKFEFTIKKIGCEPINITNGRFDAKL